MGLRSVLFEMLTGRRAFGAAEVSDVLADVLRADPDWKALPPTTLASVRRLLRRCLEKDPRRRLADIRDAPRIGRGGHRFNRRGASISTRVA
jgi:serine/threonine protein kinase